MSGTLPLMWRKYAERYTLEGNQCTTCKTNYFPARTICPTCHRKGKLTPKEMPREGTILTHTEVHAGPLGFESQTPYHIAIIELENKTKILAQIIDTNKEDIQIGAKVKKVFRKISDIDPEGPIAYGYKFKINK
jgi:uncharacterized protein